MADTPVVNLVNPTGFEFKILRLPGLSYYAQSINIPGLTLPAVETPNPFKSIPQQGDHVVLDSFDVTFLVDENLSNWIAIRNWMRGIGFPSDFEEHRTLQAQPTGFGLLSDATLVITSNARTANIRVKFKNISPIALSSLYFDTRIGDDEPISCSVSFSLDDYEIEVD